jgi:transposase
VVLVSSLPYTPLTVDALLRVIAERDAEVALLKHMVDKLKLQLARRVREQYGRSSEQLDAQLTLIPADAPKACEASAAQPPKMKPRKPRRDQRKLPEHLPRETQVLHPKGYAADAQCACSECGGKLRQIGEDVAEQLEYVPGRFKVIRHVRPKLACVRCEGIFQAMAPSRPIVRGLPGPALLAHVMVAKYCDHTPLYRHIDAMCHRYLGDRCARHRALGEDLRPQLPAVAPAPATLFGFHRVQLFVCWTASLSLRTPFSRRDGRALTESSRWPTFVVAADGGIQCRLPLDLLAGFPPLYALYRFLLRMRTCTSSPIRGCSKRRACSTRTPMCLSYTAPRTSASSSRCWSGCLVAAP